METIKLEQEQPMAIGPWIKRCREQKGMSLETLAAKVGCAQTTIESMERQYPMRKGEPPYQPAAKLMQAILDELELHITLEELAKVTDWRGLYKKKGTFGFNSPKVNRFKRKKKDLSEPKQTRKRYLKDILFLTPEVQEEFNTNLETIRILTDENQALRNYIRELLKKDLDSLIEEQIDSIAKGGKD